MHSHAFRVNCCCADTSAHCTTIPHTHTRAATLAGSMGPIPPTDMAAWLLQGVTPKQLSRPAHKPVVEATAADPGSLLVCGLMAAEVDKGLKPGVWGGLWVCFCLCVMGSLAAVSILSAASILAAEELTASILSHMLCIHSDSRSEP